jgi:glycine/D-amino acid oxidase-like deaminating enzyme
MPTQAEYENGRVPIECSGWPSVKALPPFPTLEGDAEADVAIVGAGLAGTSLALHLAEQGVSVVLLEARQPGNGASGRNAGHVQPFLDNLATLRTWPDHGERFLDFFIRHRDIVFDLCARHGIDGDAQKSGMVAASLKPQPPLEKKAKQWQALGYDVDVVGIDQLRRLLGTDTYRYGLHWREGGRVNPFLFTQGMARTAVAMGARVHGDSPVTACERAGARWRIDCARGSVRAEKVVLCTNGHFGNGFFPELARTNYPLVACALATRPLPQPLLESLNPSRAAVIQFPTGLYPFVIDGRGRLITATIPLPRRAAAGQTYFNYFLQYLHRTFPQARDYPIELEAYWTGMTASTSHVIHADYPALYRLGNGAYALMNLGTWGNVMGPQLGMHVAQVLARGDDRDFILPVQTPSTVRFQHLFSWKTRHFLMPAARIIDRLGLA